MTPSQSHSLTASCCYMLGCVSFSFLFFLLFLTSIPSHCCGVYCTVPVNSSHPSLLVESVVHKRHEHNFCVFPRNLLEIAALLADSSNDVAFPVSASLSFQICCISSAANSHNTSSKLWYVQCYILNFYFLP